MYKELNKFDFLWKMLHEDVMKIYKIMICEKNFINNILVYTQFDT